MNGQSRLRVFTACSIAAAPLPAKNFPLESFLHAETLSGFESVPNSINIIEKRKQNVLNFNQLELVNGRSRLRVFTACSIAAAPLPAKNFPLESFLHAETLSGFESVPNSINIIEKRKQNVLNFNQLELVNGLEPLTC